MDSQEILEPEKCKRGRPRKNPLPDPPGPGTQTTKEGPSSTKTKSGWVVRRSKKASQVLTIQEEKHKANQVAAARGQLKRMREEFTIQPTTRGTTSTGRHQYM